jgi:hypothetical protein
VGYNAPKGGTAFFNVMIFSQQNAIPAAAMQR